MRSWLLVVVMSGVAIRAAAQDPAIRDPRAAQPERPTVATHAFVVAPGVIEVELGIQSRPQLDVPGLIKIGLAPRLQLDIAPAWLRAEEGVRATSGFTDTTIGVKWHVADRVPLLGAFALQPTVTLPTGSGSEGLGGGDTALNLLVISSHDVGGMSLDVNVGGTFRRETPYAPQTATVWAVAAGVPLTGRLTCDAELFGYPGTAGPAGSPPVVGFLTGPTFAVSKRLVLDAGVIASIAGFGPTAVFTGLTWNAARAWHRTAPNH